MARRAALALAIVAALFGAPRPVGAASNVLTPLAPTPASGTTVTHFTLRADYDGQFDATAVVVEVAGYTIAMQRVAGTAARGTWAASTVLPAGTWTPTYRAVVVHGRSPSATGSSLTVTAAGAPLPPPPGRPPPTPGPTAGAGAGGPAQNPQWSAPDAPAGSAGAIPAATSAAAATSATAEVAAPGAAATPTLTTPDTIGHDTPSTPTGGVATPAGTADRPASPGAGAPEATTAPANSMGAVPAAAHRPTPSLRGHLGDGLMPGDDVAGSMTPAAAVGLAVTAGAALLGTLVLLVARGRDVSTAATAAAPTARSARAAAPASETPSETPEDATAALLDRRARRRSHIVLPEDPIVAALGLADPPNRETAPHEAGRKTERR